jgi:hypothetical protein
MRAENRVQAVKVDRFAFVRAVQRRFGQENFNRAACAPYHGISAILY